MIRTGSYILKNSISRLNMAFPTFKFSMQLGNQFELDPSIPSFLKQSDFIQPRFIGPNDKEKQDMLKACNCSSMAEFLDKLLPKEIRWENHINQVGKLPEAITESAMLEHLKELASKNELHKNYIGEGFYGTFTPPVILRNIFENPIWYTAYTPYQAEISQGRLEALLNYQTMISELTGMDIANASLLDEGSAAAESMYLAFNWFEGKKKIFFIDQNVFDKSAKVVQTRAKYIGAQVVIGDATTFDFESIKDSLCGVLVQTPNKFGTIIDWTDLFTNKLGNFDSLKVMGTDLLSLTLVKTPKEMGAHVTYGNSQRFGVPMGFGGPHAAYFATLEQYKRKMPGRVIGISKDVNGKPAFRMSMQTREQHIRREKATSNICTAQALLANMAGFYGLYHGPLGLKRIAKRINGLAQLFQKAAAQCGFSIYNADKSSCTYFDTVVIETTKARDLQEFLFKNRINVRTIEDNHVVLSFDETTTLQDIQDLYKLFQQYTSQTQSVTLLQLIEKAQVPLNQNRQSEFMTQQIFNSLHSETQMLRYINFLGSKDVTLAKSMISLGSCTMKSNPTSFMMPVSFTPFSQLHPYSPPACTKGYQELTNHLEKWLARITEMHSVCLQPNSGASGELTGLLTIRKYHESKGEAQKRNICLIPISAHGTNPASASLAGMKVVVVQANQKDGSIDIEDLKKQIAANEGKIGAIMLTYPSTYGVFEAEVKTVIDVVHEAGGLVYMDGANMNAQCGYTSPGYLGADVCHMNLHKTFSIPHGGGGPGVGPIAVAAKLTPFLPGKSQSIGSVASAFYGSASILPISYAYFGQLGRLGVQRCTEMALLNANYLMKSLQDSYPILFQGQNQFCAHEFILDIRQIKKTTKISEEDIAKRLMDYGFHAPTMSFPVPGTLMVEPTESEDKDELDRFIMAMKSIREEIRKVENGAYDKVDNPLKNAPHSEEMVTTNDWKHKYTREEAAFPLPFVKQRGKLWPSTGRIDNVFGDRNLVCVCHSTSDFI